MLIGSEQPLYFVTGNEGKWREVQAILGDQLAIERANIDGTLFVPELQGTIEQVARHKCSHAANLVKGAVITEDTALCFDALNGLPGPYIKWFLSDIGLEKLYTLLEGFEEKGASAICTLTYSAGPGEEPILFQGITRGRIVRPRGEGNFGWDPIFQPDHPSNLTYAEMSAEVKNAISHRGKAFSLLRAHLLERS